MATTQVPTQTQTPTPTPTSSSHDDSKVYARIEALPAAPYLGTWTLGGVNYAANSETEFEQERGAFTAGACVKAEFDHKNGVNTLEEVKTQEAYKCQSNAPGESANTYSAFGGINSFSMNQPTTSTWVVSGISYTVNASTTLKPEQGAFAVGAFVEVRYITQNNARVAIKIETHVAPGAGAGNATGLLGTQPNDDWGTWIIGGASYQGDRAIRVALAPTSLRAPNASLLVRVNYYFSKGVNYATLIQGLGRRIYLPLAQR